MECAAVQADGVSPRAPVWQLLEMLVLPKQTEGFPPGLPCVMHSSNSSMSRHNASPLLPPPFS